MLFFFFIFFRLTYDSKLPLLSKKTETKPVFQSGRFDGSSIRQLTHETVDGSIIEAASRELEMDKKNTLDAFEVLFAMVHGYASLIANNALEYDPDSLRTVLDKVGESLMNR